MNRSIIASVALATALFVGCAKKEEVPVEIPANTTAIADSLAKIKADSIVQASHDSIMRVDSQMQANNAKGTKPVAKKPAPTKPNVALPTNPDGSATSNPKRPSR